MKKNDSRLPALLRLMDDPDAEVYDAVCASILAYGKAAIPDLEALWEHSADALLQDRIETLIHRVHFTDLQAALYEWAALPAPDLLRGALLLARYHYPALNAAPFLAQFDQMRRNLWLELNGYQSPMEQAQVFNSILYSYYRLQGHELSVREPKYFFVNNTLESRQGNAFTIGILYLALADLLDVPVFAVALPRQFLLAFIDARYPPGDTRPQQHIRFFIDPQNGGIYTVSDVDKYLRKINAGGERPGLFTPLSNKRVLYNLLEELALCYRYNHDDVRAGEVEELMRILM